MKHIITTVGTSVYTNYRKEDVVNCIKNDGVSLITPESFKDINDKEYTASMYNSLKETIYRDYEDNFIKKYWLKDTYAVEGGWNYQAGSNKLNLDASAEIKSICKIIEESKDTEFKIYLICSDTAICMSAGHLVKAFFEDINLELKNSERKSVSITFSDYSPVAVDGLIIDNANSFVETAIYNLISRLDKVKDQKDVIKNDIILNISGGYKALIPIITIYAQIRENDIAYVYEDSNELITITPFPLKFDTEVYFSDGLLIRQDFLDVISCQVGDTKPASELKNIFQKLLDRQRQRKLVHNSKIKRTTLGVVLRSLSASDIEGDFGDKVIEIALKEFFNSKVLYKDYHTTEIKICIGNTLLTQKGEKKCEGKNLKVDGCNNDVHISEIDIEMLKDPDTKVIGEIKALIANNDYIKKVNTCEDYFYKMKGRILKHNDFENFKDKPIEFLYIVYAFQFDASRKSFKGNPSVEHFRKRFSEDEDLKELNVSFRALGLTIPIEKPLEFNYEEFKKDWTKYLYETKNWEEL